MASLIILQEFLKNFQGGKNKNYCWMLSNPNIAATVGVQLIQDDSFEAIIGDMKVRGYLLQMDYDVSSFLMSQQRSLLASLITAIRLIRFIALLLPPLVCLPALFISADTRAMWYSLTLKCIGKLSLCITVWPLRPWQQSSMSDLDWYVCL